MLDVKNIGKNWLFWFVIIVFLEFAFIFVMNHSFNGEILINVFLHTAIVSSVLSIISNVFKEKINFYIVLIILFILGILFSTQCVFFNSFKTYFALSNLGLSDQLTSFFGETIKCILKNTLYIIIFMLPFILYIILNKKISLKRNKLYNYISYGILTFIFLCAFLLHMNLTKGKINSTYDLYHNVNEVSLNIEKLGVLNSYELDFYRLLFGFDAKIVNVNIEENIEDKEDVVSYTPNTLDIDFNKYTSNNDIIKINQYMMSDAGSMKNEYTGMFEGYNLIYITAESFSELGVSKELTPTLYKMINTGFVFDNYYTPNVLSTIGGEFQSLTGLYPDSSILPKWRSGTNYFPYGLATVFSDLGYDTFAYHNNSYVFQDRNLYLKSQGFNNFLACYNGIEKRMNCNLWPQSDDEMMKVTLPDYINSESPFLAYYMTVSGHFEYSFSDNCMSEKHQALVKDLNLSEEAKAYIATQIELDRSLQTLIDSLEKAGKLDKTVFVLLADHYPYELSMNAVNSLSSYQRDDVVEVNHNALIIWNSELEEVHIEKACMSSDVLPTVYNLFGIDYDSRLFTGRDILSTSSGIAIFRNHSWVTDYGTYFANTGKFEAKKEVSEDYVKSINDLVNNRLNISKLIVDTNYYDYLFK